MLSYLPANNKHVMVSGSLSEQQRHLGCIFFRMSSVTEFEHPLVSSQNLLQPDAVWQCSAAAFNVKCVCECMCMHYRKKGKERQAELTNTSHPLPD